MTAKPAAISDSHPFIDLLIVTALEEERFLLDSKFEQALRKNLGKGNVSSLGEIQIHGSPGSQSNTHRGKGLRLQSEDGQKLNIAWFGLGDTSLTQGNSMGNIFAYDECLQIAKDICPRFILLFGIAGGHENSFKLGDVGYGIRTFYSTYCKVKQTSPSISSVLGKNRTVPSREKSKVQQILQQCGIPLDIGFSDYEPRKVRAIMSDGGFCETCNLVAHQNEWKQTAKALYDDAGLRDGFVSKISDYKLGNEARKQKPFPRNAPNAGQGNVASGDAIVADPEFQMKIISDPEFKFHEKDKKLNIAPNMFEMESYGMALFCERHHIKYGIIKGICDLAGGSKGDGHRYCAQCSAFAFTARLVSNKSFISSVLGSSKKRVFAGINDCVWPHSPCGQRCVKLQKRAPDDDTKRPCVALNGSIKKNTELHSVRVFQQDNAADYSKTIEEFIKDVGDAQRLLTIFPYGADELLEFVSRATTLTADERKHLDTLRLDTKSLKPKGLRDMSITVGTGAYRAHDHFKAANEKCAKWIGEGKKFKEIALRICRVVYLSDSDRKQLRSDPRFLVHLLMWGGCVPTLIADKSIEAKGTDEATYLNCGSDHCRASHGRHGVTTCLKYADRSRLLTLVGCCGEMPQPTEEIPKIFDVFDEATRWICRLDKDVIRKPGGASHFEFFPVIRLLRRHNLLDDASTHLFPGVRGKRGTFVGKVKSYLDMLEGAEMELK